MLKPFRTNGGAKSLANTALDTKISVGRAHLDEKGEEENSGWAEMRNKMGRKPFGPGDQQDKAQVMMVHP